MATFKHISSKNADYGAAEKYLIFAHDEFSMKPTLDENGRLMLREDFRISTLNCNGDDFAIACMRANLRYGKNQKREDVKSHHYIISFDPRDGMENGLTVDRAQQLGEKFCAEHFKGHQAIICTHPDGHNHSGNIHVHIVINSLRIEEVPMLPYMDRPADTREGCKHRCTDAAMEYFKTEVMEMCHRENLYQIDLLHGSQNRITEREYWAKKKGQVALDERNAKIISDGLTPRNTKFETDKDKLRQIIRKALENATTFDEFSAILLRQGISVKESRGRLSYLTPDRTKPITARRLGDDFDRAAVFARLEENTQAVLSARAEAVKEVKSAPKRSIVGELHEKQTAIQNDRLRRTKDIDALRSEGKNEAYIHKVKITNLQQAAKARVLFDYGFESYEDLDTAIAAAQKKMQESYAAYKAFDGKIVDKKELQGWILKYVKTKDVYQGLNAITKEKEREAYRQKHEADFIIYESALRFFKSHGITKLPTYKAVQAEIETLIAEKNTAYNIYKADKARYNELKTIQQNLAYLTDEPKSDKSKKHEHAI